SATLVEQSQLVKIPILLTFISGLAVFSMALRLRECAPPERHGWSATVRQSWKQTVVATRWIWMTPLAFGIVLAVMCLDNVIRQFLTLASEYWNVIQLPIASYGLIGSGMALLGLFVPRLARIMAEKNTALKNFIISAALVFVGLFGLAYAVPYWGILPAVLLYVAMGFTNFFVSRYMNEVAPSEQRATVLSFRGLTTNFAYGAVSILYSLLIATIKEGENLAGFESSDALQKSVFVESLKWFPWYFLVTVALVFVVHRLRFGSRKPG
ncbi:MAG: MFS transporter, partial [Verrucomicrobiota bacterium]